MNDAGIIILAAGSSSRFDGIKQLLNYNGKSLIEHAVDEALNAELNPVIVVTGANAQKISQAINHHQKIQIVFNERWQQGMATGIVCGLSAVLSFNKNITNIIIAVCDQPFVSASLFQQMIDKKIQTDKNIIACAYADTVGTPVLFSQKYFDELMDLKGDEGAKNLLKMYNNDVATIDFPQGNIDIDTKENYEQLLDKQKHVL